MITKVKFNKSNRTNRPSLARNSEVKYRGKKLTKQQIVILEHLGIGSTNPEIANSLGLSPRTVESHLQSIRKLISEEIGYRLGDRELVLFARDMLEGYEVFINLQEELDKAKKSGALIEDWEDEDKEEPEEENEPLELTTGLKTFNGVPVPKDQPRRYLPKAKIFNIEEFKVESKDVVYQNGVYILT